MCENANSRMLRGHQLKQLQAGHIQPPLVLSGMNTGHMHRYIAQIETQKNTFRHTWVNTHTHPNTHGYKHIWARKHTHSDVQTHTSTHIQIHKHTWIHRHTNVHKYIHIHTDTLKYI